MLSRRSFLRVAQFWRLPVEAENTVSLLRPVSPIWRGYRVTCHVSIMAFIIYIHYSITTSLLLVHWFYIYVIYISFLISPCTILTPVTFSLDLLLMLASHVASINAWRDHMQIEDTVMRDALFLDASAESWPRITENNDKIDGVMCINMIHIAPWKCCLGLLRHSATLLKSGAPLIFYGPFIQGELETALSNIRFDESLKQRNSEWGLRTLESVRHAGMEYGFTLVTVLEVPANNLIVIFRKQWKYE